MSHIGTANGREAQHQFEVDGCLAIEGLFPDPSLPRYTKAVTLSSAVLPSPLVAVHGDDPPTPGSPLDRVSEELQEFYHLVVSNRKDIFRQMGEQPALDEQGYNPHYVCYRRVGEKSDSCPYDGQVLVHLPGDAMHSTPRSCIIEEASPLRPDINARPSLLLYQRYANAETQRWEYILVNQNLNSLRLNSERAPPNNIYGPLPDFTIIEVEGAMIFWWRSRAALDYVPALTQRIAGNAAENSTEDTPEEKADQPSEGPAEGPAEEPNEKPTGEAQHKVGNRPHHRGPTEEPPKENTQPSGPRRSSRIAKRKIPDEDWKAPRRPPKKSKKSKQPTEKNQRDSEQPRGIPKPLREMRASRTGKRKITQSAEQKDAQPTQQQDVKSNMQEARNPAIQNNEAIDANQQRDQRGGVLQTLRAMKRSKQAYVEKNLRGQGGTTKWQRSRTPSRPVQNEPMAGADGSALPNNSNLALGPMPSLFIPPGDDEALERDWNLEFIHRLFDSKWSLPRALELRGETGQITFIDSHEWLWHEDVVSAIGSLWTTLLRAKNTRFAFGIASVFQMGKYANNPDIPEVQNGGRTLIMPLYLTPRDTHGETSDGRHIDRGPRRQAAIKARARSRKQEVLNRMKAPRARRAEQAAKEAQKRDGQFEKSKSVAEAKTSKGKRKQSKPASVSEHEVNTTDFESDGAEIMTEKEIAEQDSKTGHILLAVATRGDDRRVGIEFYDSAPGHCYDDQLRLAARNIIRNSAWALRNKTEWTGDQRAQVVRQTGDACGLHTILNAWAFMLGLELEPQVQKLDLIYLQAVGVINLALRGQLNIGAIRAFLMATGWCVRRPLNQDERTHDALQCTAMNDATLARVWDVYRREI